MKVALICQPGSMASSGVDVPIGTDDESRKRAESILDTCPRAVVVAEMAAERPYLIGDIESVRDLATALLRCATRAEAAGAGWLLFPMVGVPEDMKKACFTLYVAAAMPKAIKIGE